MTQLLLRVGAESRIPKILLKNRRAYRRPGPAPETSPLDSIYPLRWLSRFAPFPSGKANVIGSHSVGKQSLALKSQYQIRCVSALMTSKDYTVFIDESFDEFMNLSKISGYFCHAALMVPTLKLPDLDRFWSANRERLIADYKQVTGFTIQGEFKSKYLKQVSAKGRRTFAERLGYFLRKNDCFVAGFYTTVRNFLTYRLRTGIAKDDAATTLPANWESLLPGIKASLLGDKSTQPGDAYLLLGLLHQTLSNTLNWLGLLGATFTVVYDPRQAKEDKFLISNCDDWLTREAEMKKLVGSYNGTIANVASSDSPGLMLVDLILRDVRFIFSDIPDLLSEQSSTALVLPVPQGCEPVVMSLQGARLKWGNRHPMSDELKLRLRQPSQNSMLTLYLDRLAGGKLSCEANFGESRVINFGRWCLENMVD